MPRPVRLNLPDILQYITRRGNNRQACFFSDDDYRLYLDLLVVRDLGRNHVRSINKTCRRSGTLREGRFKSSLVDKTRYCLSCHRYIELNPVPAGMVSYPADYPWSSYRCNAMGESNTLITPHDCWLILGDNDKGRMADYRNLFNKRMNQSDVDNICQSIETGLPTGNVRFRREAEQALSVKPGTGKRGKPRKGHV